MSTRDEMAATIRPVLGDYGAMGTVPPERPLGLPGWGDRLWADESDCPEAIADALIVEGWRKKPSLSDVLAVLAGCGIGPNGEEPHSWRCSDKGLYPGGCECPGEISADILALMDRGLDG